MGGIPLLTLLKYPWAAQMNDVLLDVEGHFVCGLSVYVSSIRPAVRPTVLASLPSSWLGLRAPRSGPWGPGLGFEDHGPGIQAPNPGLHVFFL